MKGFRAIWGVFILLVVLVIGARAYFFAGAKEDGHHVYSITVHNFSGDQTYMTSDYKKDSATGCLTFKDEFGLKNTVCGNYSITEW